MLETCRRQYGLPVNSASTYTHAYLQLQWYTKAGPSVRAGFSEAPVKVPAAIQDSINTPY